MAPEVRIALTQVSRWYGQILGVSDVTLNMGRGIYGLLGPNGAGKSSLMKMCVGLLPPSRGKVEVLGGEPFTNAEVRRRIGYCPEHDGLYDELTGREMVSALLELGGFSREEAQRRAVDALGRMGLQDAQDRRVGGYSKGMRQRVKLAQALAHDPEVLFLDEPLTGCDPVARNRIIEELRALGAAGKTIVISSHVLYEIEAVTREIVVIHRGQVLAEGNVFRIRELIDSHPHRVRVESPEPRALAQRLIAEEHVSRVEVSSLAVELETLRPDRLYDAISAAALDGVPITALSSPDNNLGAVFAYLTSKSGSAGRAAQGARR